METIEIEYGAEVRDKTSKVVGTVNRVLRDTWTGEIRKFTVSTELTDTELFYSPEDVFEATPSEIKLKIAFDEHL
ncbi:hypothetical protein ACFLUD_02210 [Chloroflexota bacterium]